MQIVSFLFDRLIAGAKKSLQIAQVTKITSSENRFPQNTAAW